MVPAQQMPTNDVLTLGAFTPAITHQLPDAAGQGYRTVRFLSLFFHRTQILFLTLSDDVAHRFLELAGSLAESYSFVKDKTQYDSS